MTACLVHGHHSALPVVTVLVTLGQACLWHGDKITKLAVRPEEGGSQAGIAPGVQLESGSSYLSYNCPWH